MSSMIDQMMKEAEEHKRQLGMHAMVVGEGPVKFVEAIGIDIEERPFQMNQCTKPFGKIDYAGRVHVQIDRTDLCGPMAGGKDMVINGKRYLVLDRYETWATYDQLSR